MSKHCGCCHCKSQRADEQINQEPFPKEVYIIIHENKSYSRQTYYKRVLKKHRALDNLFLNLKDAKAMTRVWDRGYIVKAQIVEDISKRRDK